MGHETGSLRVETLGPLRASAGGRELPLGPPKQRAVFAVLALRAGRVVTRDDLIDCVWGASAPVTAAGSLHTYVSGLRRALACLGEPLAGSGCGYTLHLDPARLDAAAVERLTAQARGSLAGRDAAAALTAYDEALSRWQPGTALGGLPGPFAEQHRAWAADLRLQLVLERAELRLDLGQPTGVADQLRVLLADHPYHERLRVLLMTALHASGRTAEALAEYHDLRTLLADELGIDPSSDTQARYASILADNAAGPTTPPEPTAPPGPARRTAATSVAATAPAAAEPVRPAQLPPGVGHFVGRQAQVRLLLDAARAAGSAAPRFALVVGAGGVGKTALALHCAQLAAAAFPDGQVYLNLRGFDPSRSPSAPDDALHRLLASVTAGTIPADREERVALWRSIVRERRLLIVLDNAHGAEQVEDLLPGGGSCFTLVTSRNRLSGLAVRHSPPRVTLRAFSPGESLDLLAHSIGAPVRAEPAAARRLADLCDHLPLALRIASEQLASGPWSRIAELAADLEDGRFRLDTLEIPDDGLHSVRAALSWSYDRLDAAAARGFRMLGLLPAAGCRPEVAAALLHVPPSAAAAVLRSLAAHHLVEADGGGYRMSDLTRLYAKERAEQAQDADVTGFPRSPLAEPAPPVQALARSSVRRAG